jgi:hypothetical protein
MLGTSFRGNASISVRNVRELYDPAGDQLILVLSDCFGPAWRNGDIAVALDYWATRAFVAVLQVLPPRIWPRSAVGMPTRRLHATYPVMPNVRLLSEPLSFAPALPLISIDPASMTAWAKVAAGQRRCSVPGIDLERLRPAVINLRADEGDWDVEGPGGEPKKHRAHCSGGSASPPQVQRGNSRLTSRSCRLASRSCASCRASCYRSRAKCIWPRSS